MAELEKLFARYDKLVVLDTETTGLSCVRDQIIEFSAAVLEAREGRAAVTREYDALIALPPGRLVPPKIQALTGITNQDLRERGIPRTRACRDVAELFQGDRTLLLAYNAHFDLSFLYYTLVRDGDPAILRGRDKLDLLTVYRDTPTGWPAPSRPMAWAAKWTIATGPLTMCGPPWRFFWPWSENGTTWIVM